jgi:hypothetical protein
MRTGTYAADPAPLLTSFNRRFESTATNARNRTECPSGIMNPSITDERGR